MLMNDKLEAIIEPAVNSSGYELVGVEVIHSAKMLVRVYIDTIDDGGLSIDDCVAVSREVSALLDVNAELKDSYTLEVSSPGVDRKLFKLADYEKATGLRLKVRLRKLINGRRSFVGELTTVDNNELHIKEDDGSSSVIDYANVLKGNLKL